MNKTLAKLFTYTALTASLFTPGCKQWINDDSVIILPKDNPGTIYKDEATRLKYEKLKEQSLKDISKKPNCPKP